MDGEGGDGGTRGGARQDKTCLMGVWGGEKREGTCISCFFAVVMGGDGGERRY